MDELFVVVNKELSGEVPSEIQVIPYGVEILTPKGTFTCDEESAALVISSFERQENQMVIDYEHQTLQGTIAPAAGWITRLIDKGKAGIWAAVEWTARAKEFLAKKEYKYVSPVFMKRLTDNPVMQLINVALTNQPNIDGMVPLVNKLDLLSIYQDKEEKPMKELLKLLGLAENATETEAIAAVNKFMTPVVVANKAVLTAIGLAETATEADAIAAIGKLKTPSHLVANKAGLTALGLAETASEAEITGTIMAMKQSHDRVGALSQELANLKTDLVKKDATELVTQAMKDGKITPAQKEWADAYAARDLEGSRCSSPRRRRSWSWARWSAMTSRPRGHSMSRRR
jgi:phage I-like protein